MSDDSYNVTMYACEAETKNIEFCHCAIEGFIDIILDNKSTLNRFGEIETPPMIELTDVINQIMRNQMFCKAQFLVNNLNSIDNTLASLP